MMFALPETSMTTDQLVQLVLNWEYSLDDSSDHDDMVDTLLSVLENPLSKEEHESLCKQCLANYKKAEDIDRLSWEDEEDEEIVIPEVTRKVSEKPFNLAEILHGKWSK